MLPLIFYMRLLARFEPWTSTIHQSVIQRVFCVFFEKRLR